ncbi:MAG TPA: peptidylprolyl isomerase [Planctomycetota bacterium]|nr:peptidylprolyl isomerase [Planctomycetota bacterium]
MARPDPRLHGAPLRAFAFAGAVAFGAIACSTAQETPPPPPAQEPPKEPAKEPAKEPVKEPAKPAQDAAPKDAPAPAPERKMHVKKCTVPGADPSGELYLAALGKDGRRSEFGPLAPETAFEVWLEGLPPQKVTTQEPDPANPGQTHPVEHLKVPVAPVSFAEFDGYFANARSIRPVSNEGMFFNSLLASLLEQRAVVLYYYDVLPGMKERLQRAADKIDRGIAFDKVIKQNSEDDQGKMTGGWFGDNFRGENLGRYPFEQIVFGLEPGDVVGPVFDRWFAYLITCEKRSLVDEKHPQERVLTRTVNARYAVNGLTQKDFGRIFASIRMRSDKERILRVLPPGVQVPPPKTFGPDDVAPLGKPDTPLKHRSSDDASDNKARTDH